MGIFFFTVTLVFTCRAFFGVSLENNCPIYCFGHSLSQSVSHWNSFSPLKYIVYKRYNCFRPGMGNCFFIVTVVYTCRAFFAVSLENNCPIYCFGHSLSQSVLQWNSIFSFKIHCLQMLHLFQTMDGPIFFIVTLIYTCRAFFVVSSENNCPIYCFGHSLSQSVSQWNSIFSFKIHWIQMLHLFQIRDGPIFFIITLVYTCRAFFAVWSENIYPIFCFGYNLSQSALQWNSIFSFKIHWIQMLELFQTRDGPVFLIVTLAALFFAVSSENNCPIYCFGHSLFQSFSQWNFIFSFKIHWIQMLHLFQTRNGPFFFHRHTCRAFFAVWSIKYLSYILFRSQLVSVCF